MPLSYEEVWTTRLNARRAKLAIYCAFSDGGRDRSGTSISAAQR